MAIDITNVVKVNFSIEQQVESIGSYSKVLFVYSDDLELTDAQEIYSLCGGNKSDIIAVKVDAVSGASVLFETIRAKKNEVAGTLNDFIFVCLSNNVLTNLTDSGVVSLATSISQLTAPNKLCLCISKVYENAKVDLLSRLLYYPVAVKLYPQSITNQQVCLSIPAYYAQINLSHSSTIKDYAFTVEPASLSKEGWIETSDNYESIVKVANFVEKIGDNWVNFGGNLTNGVSITGFFGSVAMENDVVYAVMRGMLKKQYLTDSGLNNIVALINQALYRYVNNGFIETNATWIGSDYVLEHGKYRKQVIKAGQLLPDGYFVARVPMSYITQEYRAARKFTPIRVFAQTQVGARIVEIDGTVLD